ncbi:MAG: hypothetical protein F4Y04_02360 [Chloroflexi bacterium]|nr:hypothetical protein [Chloroflexota bacterium]
MSFPVTYQNAMTEVANLAMSDKQPGYVRVRALLTLVRELSPLNQRCVEVKRELGIEEAAVYVDAGAESRAYMQGVRDGIASVEYERARQEEEEELADEDDDPL